MKRPSRREMRELAEDREKCAARSARNAESAKAAANDPTLSETTRKQAAATVPIALRHAQEYREEAEALRAGRIPGEDW
ncbi:hypothetical protein [Streptomyces massasporeus]|uniref:hypothetical protein n=1 Tax=Streptomyces massasporeus TaxID=67324 RepID=UPI001671EEAD|nr:hypothetical protein [Streptomyces massasporeus]GGV91669.1 hypothetical protein GCM10010228_82670 [Streptomyces massasporeus]